MARAYLPERKAENVKVTVDDARVLRIEAEAEQITGGPKGALTMKRKSLCSQYLTLRGPVDAGQIKVDRKQGMLIFTIPRKPEG